MNNCLKAMEGISKVAKTYVRVSYIKTALTAFVIGYAAIKAIKIFTEA